MSGVGSSAHYSDLLILTLSLVEMRAGVWPTLQNFKTIQHTPEIAKKTLLYVVTGNHQNSSQFRGVTLHQKGKWEARIGTLVGRKYK